MRRKRTYIHYGTNYFNPNHPLGKDRSLKPSGLWASPRYSDWGWRSWCEREEFRIGSLDKCFKFRLKKGTKILHINHLEDIVPYLVKTDDYERYKAIFPSLFEDPTQGMELNSAKLKEEYDGMEVHMSDNYGELHNSYMFYTYDVDSLVLWNLDKVICVRQVIK